MPNMQTAPIEEVIEYLTVTLKKKWGSDEGDRAEETTS